MALAISSYFTRGRSFWPLAALFLLLAVSLLLLAGLVSDAALFGQYQLWLLGFNVVLLVLFIILVSIGLVRLVRRVMEKRPGSRLAAKLAALFIVFALIPATVLYTFSTWLMGKGIESWFDIEVESALEDALDLSRYSLNAQLEQYRKQWQPFIGELTNAPDDLAVYLMNSHIQTSGASELLLLGNGQRIIASVSDSVRVGLLPDLPPDSVAMQVLQTGEPYLGVDEAQSGGLYARLVFALAATEAVPEARILQVLYSVPQRVNTLAGGVQKTYRRYDQIAYLRTGLNQNLIIVLTLVLLSAVFYAMWAAFFSTRRVMHPILRLTSATQAVAAGDLNTKIETTSRDDLGTLINSFNSMTSRLEEARDIREQNRQQLENQRSYLHTVLANVSSGVLSLDQDLRTKTTNQAIVEMIGTSEKNLLGITLSAADNPAVARFYQAIQPELEGAADTWEKQFSLLVGDSYRYFICRGTRMPNGGYVIVLNDITQVVQAQRESAWGEVARHLAHEIKNPLTPIQLSTEQLSKKLHSKLAIEDAGLLQRSTRTIIEQVKAMKSMVDEFSQYSRPAPPHLEPVEANRLVKDITDLYRSDRYRLELDLDAQNPNVSGDKSRLRQLLHNLLKNAVEALENHTRDGVIRIATRTARDAVELEVRDNGPGFSKPARERFFEPYMTTKPKGKGLGLAIVKKIVEEHNGAIQVLHPDDGGVSIVIKLRRLTSPQESTDGK